MKKIIYSLVIMIAAGSLFTSCIEQVEPVGILDLRQAKAEYIRGLLALRNAEAERVRAEAAVLQADARYRDAETAWMNAQTANQLLLNEYQQLLNEAKAAENEQAIKEWELKYQKLVMDMEEAAKQHEINMVNLEKALQQAMFDYEVAMRNIALAAQDLTAQEKMAVAEAAASCYALLQAKIQLTARISQKEMDIAAAKEALAWAAKEYDGTSHVYRNALDYYNLEIKRAQAKIDRAKEEKARLAEIKAAGHVDNDVLNAFKDIIKEYEDEANAIEFEKHNVTKEIAEYYTQYVHHNVELYNKTLQQWQKDNPVVANPGKAPKEPKESDYPVAAFEADSIAIPVLDATKVAATPFNKLVYLLSGYAQKSPAGKAPMANDFIQKDKDGNIQIVANQSMKDFILGAAQAKELTYTYKDKDGKDQKVTAKYGLKGALDVLERELVTDKDKAADPEKAKKAMDDAEKAWKADRDILLAGLDKYKPYTDALAAYEKAVADNGAGAKGMADAINKLMEELNKVNNVAGFTSFTYNDSLAVFNAMVNFAKAREEYLDYTYDKTKEAKNQSMFRFATGKTGGKVSNDSVAFSALSWDDFAAHKYDYTFEKGLGFISGEDISATPALNMENGIANIADQLLNNAAKFKFNYPTITTCAPKDLEKALYTGYTLTVKDGKADAIQKGGKPYEPKALTTAKDNVKKAVAAYVTVYNNFWAENVGNISKTAPFSDFDGDVDNYFSKTKAADKTKALADLVKNVNAKTSDVKDAACYEKATFTEPYNVVFFTGAAIDYNEDLGAILVAVDPKSTGVEGSYATTVNSTAASIFYGPAGTTEFYKLMKATWDYTKALEPATESIKAIQEWIAAVEAAFAKDVTDAEAAAAKAYAGAKKTYDEKTKPAYDEAKAEYDAYIEALGEFTGIDPQTEAPYGLLPIVGTYAKPDDITPDKCFELMQQDIFGYYDWVDNLAGEQLELAEMLFPDMPEESNGWKIALDEINDASAHNRIMANTLKDAYKAAAMVAENEDLRKDAAKAADWDALWSNYRTKLDNAIAKQDGIINSNYTVIDNMQKNIKEFHEYDPTTGSGALNADKLALQQKIVDLQAQLQTLNLALAGVEKAYDLAKINYDKIMEYVQSVGAEFVIPVSGYDLRSLLGNTLDLLDNLGIDVGSIVSSMVGGGAGATTTTSGNTITINF